MSSRPKSSNRYDELSLQVVHHPSEPVLTREWLRLVRERQGLRQVDVAARLAELGPHAALTCSQLSKLERGKMLFSFLGFFRAEGLRQVLDIPEAEWDERMQQVGVPLQRRAP
jgi:transcriptional regulator with XRE-family HTH domain